MCGIVGFLNFSQQPASPRILAEMSKLIAHRGPDGNGIWHEGAVALAHQRLSIIDLSPAGQQPMQSACGRYVISYNGEVYNYQALRTELEALGHHFYSKTDTEVVLKAFVQWELDALPKFNGMFAFALYDRQAKRLYLARDRYGVKPLYYTHCAQTFLFGSEIKSFTAHPDFKSQMNVMGLHEYLTFQNFISDDTLFKNVKLLPAGCCLTLSQDINTLQLHRYWDFCFTEPEAPMSSDEITEELDFLFQQAVTRQLVSDVPVGSYLSGGMDSGSITAIAAKQIPYMTTFTCGFDLHSASGMELNFDERAAAEHMSYLFKTEHYEMVLKAGDMERCLNRLTYHLEEPRVGQSYPNFYSAQLASKFVKVVLSGAGGDELFAGYPWRYYRAVVNHGFEDYVDQYYAFWQRLLPGDQRSALLSPIWSEAKHLDTRALFKSIFPASIAEATMTPEHAINLSLYFEAKTFLHGLLLIEDKISMSHSLETRVPFLDNDLVDFAMKIPASMKLGKLNEVKSIDENDLGTHLQKYLHKTRDGKLILRRMMAKHIPNVVADREKQGFSAPDASWFKGESLEYVRQTLLNKNAKLYDFLDFDMVQALVGEHLQGVENRRLLIWSLLSCNLWCQHWL